MHAADDTIVAVSSPPGRSARGLIRLSGFETPRILRGSIDGDLPPSRTLAPTRLRLQSESAPASAASSIPILLAVFDPPRTYTGQAMAELQLPGNPALLDRVLHSLSERGARLAEAGEFTFRAFLAGKLDLTQAEGVAATITATSDAQLRAASALREGRLGRLAGEIVEGLATILALVEAGIDFTDQEDVTPIAPAALASRLGSVTAAIEGLLEHPAWSQVEALPRAVLVGAPSTGKSTLFNALLGRERAVASPLPGTTRDVLAEPLTLIGPDGRSVEVMLVDIAGLDDPRGALDVEIQAAARGAIAGADLILAVDDGAGGALTGVPREARSRPGLKVRTKADLASSTGDGALPVSALTGAGLDDLRAAMLRHLNDASPHSAETLALRPRHTAALRSAAESLADADALMPGSEAGALGRPELVAETLRLALDHLASIGGTMTPDDIIGRVFATFCVGK